MEETVIVLNADYTPLNVVRFRRAINLVLNKKAVVVEAGKRILMNAEKTFKLLVPKIIRLVEYVVCIRRNQSIFSRKNVLIRDNFKCGYCGKTDVQLNVDHIIPKARGGKSEYGNCVAACFDCNNRKGNRTPEEAGMRLLHKPYVPSLSDFIQIKMRALGVYEKLKFDEMELV